MVRSRIPTLDLSVGDVILRTREKANSPTVLNNLNGWVFKVTKRRGRFVTLDPVDFVTRKISKKPQVDPLPEECFGESLWRVLRPARIVTVVLRRPPRYLSGQKFHSLSIDLHVEVEGELVVLTFDRFKGDLSRKETCILDEGSQRMLTTRFAMHRINYTAFFPSWEAIKTAILELIPGQ